MTNKNKIQKSLTKKHLNRLEREQRQLKIITIVTVITLSIILILVAYGLIDAYLIKPSRIVAKVGEQEIRAGDFQTQVKYSRFNSINEAYMYYQYSQMFGDYGSSYLNAAQSLAMELEYSPETIGDKVLEGMISDILIAEKAEELGITVTEEEVEKALESKFEYFPEGTPTPTITPTLINTPTLSTTQIAILAYTSTPELSPTIVIPTPDNTKADNKADTIDATLMPTATVTPTPTPYTEKGFNNAVDEYLGNLLGVRLSREELKDIVRNEILREKLIEEITKDIKPVQEKFWTRHILVDTEEKAQKIRERLIDGKDWQYIVDIENDISENSTRYEDLGWMSKGRLEPAFEAAALALEIGEISLPIQTSYGWHVIQLIAKGPVDLTESEFQTLKQETFTEWLNNLRSERSDIIKFDIWKKILPTTPSVPTEFFNNLISAGY